MKSELVSLVLAVAADGGPGGGIVFMNAGEVVATFGTDEHGSYVQESGANPVSIRWQGRELARIDSNGKRHCGDGVSAEACAEAFRQIDHPFADVEQQDSGWYDWLMKPTHLVAVLAILLLAGLAIAAKTKTPKTGPDGGVSFPTGPKK